MNMIDLYVSEVGRNLPPKMRADIEREIRSSVMDALDDASRQQGREPDEEMVVEVLRKLGPPARVAASYQPPKYLIGPNLYPTFVTVLRIVLTVIAILTAVGVGVKLGTTSGGVEAVLRVLGEGALGLLNGAIAVIGYVVLAFAIVQRLNPGVKFDEKTWDPRELKAEPDPDQVKPAGTAIDMVLTLALLALLNFYPHWIGITAFVDGAWRHAPVLGSGFFQYMPWINLVLIAGVVVNALLIRRGAWTPALRWFSIAVQLASIVLLAWLLAGTGLLSLEASQLVQAGWDPAAANGLARAVPTFALLFRMGLGIALITQVIEVAKKVYRQVSPKLPIPA
jgi:hypothetical protein